jgi:hypothetical protein
MRGSRANWNLSTRPAQLPHCGPLIQESRYMLVYSDWQSPLRKGANATSLARSIRAMTGQPSGRPRTTRAYFPGVVRVVRSDKQFRMGRNQILEQAVGFYEGYWVIRSPVTTPGRFHVRRVHQCYRMVFLLRVDLDNSRPTVDNGPSVPSERKLVGSFESSRRVLHLGLLAPFVRYQGEANGE